MNRAEAWISLEAGDLDDDARAEWLESALVGLDLATVISELTAIAGKPVAAADCSSESVRAWLGNDATAVLQRGLGSLPDHKLNELYRNPGLLPGLQELVLTEGGAHWDAQARRNDVTDKRAVLQRHRIAHSLGIDTTKAQAAAGGSSTRIIEAPQPQHDRPSTDGGRRFRRLLGVALPLTLAAAALVAVIPVWLQRTAGEHAEPELKGVAVVNVVVPEAAVGQDDAAGPDIEATGGEGWPDHPWKTMTASAPDGGAILTAPEGKIPSLPSKKLLTESRKWSRKLEGSRHLTATQVRVAAEQARGAIMAIEGLASEGALDLRDDRGTQLRAKCRAAVGELDHVDALLDGKSPGDGGVIQARRDIVRVLGDVEAALETDLEEPDATDASTP